MGGERLDRGGRWLDVTTPMCDWAVKHGRASCRDGVGQHGGKDVVLAIVRVAAGR